MSTVSPLAVPRKGMLSVIQFEARFGEIRAMTSTVRDGRDLVTSALTKTKYVHFDHQANAYVSERR